ncbi:hypothetical protein EJF36_15830 [Bacillus sp. HMF5848]|uniref:patatin-like phospholipase family protein n=1 Tax=Bacillus sp. HMF5848 TaxID=2495421 RepID=UPI000F79C0E8|nr:patatin-like phospholipase family protein [Bacillus sp. HMF5848]RSK28238.1 hypothetical protein EJF36_15830 [Bacillus sp. HMF5848]
MRTGLSLSGGSLRGAAHIGVLKEMQRQQIEITHIAGTSAGAIVAGLYACEVPFEEMEQKISKLSLRKLMDLQFGFRELIKGNRIYDMLLDITEGRHFEDVKTPLAIVALDLLSGKLVVMRSGEIAKAIRASIALPGILAPVEWDDMLLVDGYILNNNPADIVKAMGAHHVTAVQVTGSQDKCSDHLLSHISRYIGIASQYHTEQTVNKYADLLIKVDLEDMSRFAFKESERAVKLGQLQAQQSLLQYANHSLSKVYSISS